jgi:hypothetical protein
MFQAAEGAVKGLEVFCQGGMGIEIERGAHRLCNIRHRHIFPMEHVIDVMKVMHFSIFCLMIFDRRVIPDFCSMVPV